METSQVLQVPNSINRTAWRAQSPDLNIIENAWLDKIRKLIREKRFVASGDQLFHLFKKSSEYPAEKIRFL